MVICNGCGEIAKMDSLDVHADCFTEPTRRIMVLAKTQRAGMEFVRTRLSEEYVRGRQMLVVTRAEQIEGQRYTSHDWYYGDDPLTRIPLDLLERFHMMKERDLPIAV